MLDSWIDYYIVITAKAAGSREELYYKAHIFKGSHLLQDRADKEHLYLDKEVIHY